MIVGYARTSTVEQKAGFDAEAENKYKGWKPLSSDRRENVVKLAGKGTARDTIAKQLGIGVASVYRILAERKLS